MSEPRALPGFVGTPRPGFESARGRALVALETEGMPTRKTEAFRFTPVREVLEAPLVASAAELRPVAADGLTFTRAADDAGLPGASRERAFSLSTVRGFGAANVLAFGELLHVTVRAGVTTTLDLGPRAALAGEASAARVFVHVERGARLTLLQHLTSPKGALCNDVIELRIEPEATVEHVVCLDGEGAAFLDVGVEVSDDAAYDAVTALAAGAPSRLAHLVRLVGARARCTLGTAARGRHEATLDHHVRTVHAARDTRSSTTFRAIAEDRSTVVLDSIAEVRADAPGSDVVQSVKSLLVGRDAVVHGKPHLEIDVDEVTASHGATVGSFDPDALFYLRSRGLSDATARALLTEAFVREVLDRATTEGARTWLAECVLGPASERVAS